MFVDFYSESLTASTDGCSFARSYNDPERTSVRITNSAKSENLQSTRSCSVANVFPVHSSCPTESKPTSQPLHGAGQSDTHYWLHSNRHSGTKSTSEHSRSEITDWRAEKTLDCHFGRAADAPKESEQPMRSSAATKKYRASESTDVIIVIVD